MDIVGIPAIIASMIVGFLILIQKQNREKYPHRFIGYICLVQSS